MLVIYILFVIFQIISFIGFIKKKDKILINQTITNLIVVSILLLFVYLYKLEIPTYIVALCLLTIILNTFVGSLLKLYYKSKTFDRYLHTLGAFSFSLLAYKVLIIFSGEVLESAVFKAVAIFSLGVTLSGLFEISEFLSDKYKKTQNQHGLKDTNFDMIFNFIGSAIAAIFSVVAII